MPSCDMQSRRGRLLFPGSLAPCRAMEPVKRSNRCRRWGSSLVSKGLAAFREALITRGRLACLCRYTPGQFGLVDGDAQICDLAVIA
jgi:hypothetical protein